MNKENIKQTLEAFLEETDMFVVDIQVSNDNLVQISLDGDSRVSIDDCIEVARYLENQFDRDEEDFELRVSTFGIDNPVQYIRQLNKVVGSEILFKKDETPEQRARLEKIDGNNLYITHRLKKGGPKSKAQIYKDGDSEVLSFDELEYVKEIIRF